MKEHKVDGGKLLGERARELFAKYANEPEPQPPAAAKAAGYRSQGRAAAAGQSGQSCVGAAACRESRTGAEGWCRGTAHTSDAAGFASDPLVAVLEIVAGNRLRLADYGAWAANNAWWQFWKSAGKPAPATAP